MPDTETATRSQEMGGQQRGQQRQQGSWTPQEVASGQTKLNLNSASAAELQMIPEIGPKTAQGIVRERELKGGFKDWSDVEAIPNMGAATIGNLKAHTVLQSVSGTSLLNRLLGIGHGRTTSSFGNGRLTRFLNNPGRAFTLRGGRR